MAIKSILSPYGGNTNASRAALDYTIKAAQLHDAWITGVVAHGQQFLQKRFGGMISSQILKQLAAQDEERIQDICRSFNETIEAAGWTEKSEFFEITNEEDRQLSAFARGFDLIIVGAHSGELSDSHMSPHPDLLAMQSGRPVLVIPEKYETKDIPQHVLLAWDGKRAAARAVAEAMVILERKAKVTIVTIGSIPGAPVDGPGGIQILLERHGIKTEHINHKSASGGVGKQLLKTAEEIDAGMIVMGAYEHSKFSHDLLGGVTTDVMKKATVPVLLVH